MMFVDVRFRTPTHRLTVATGRGRRMAFGEKRVEAFVCRTLRAAGVPYLRQHPLFRAAEFVGVTDIITPAELIEVKGDLDRGALLRGLGQALIFGKIVGLPSTIVGRRHRDLEVHRALIESFGVSVVVVDDGRFEKWPEGESIGRFEWPPEGI